MRPPEDNKWGQVLYIVCSHQDVNWIGYGSPSSAALSPGHQNPPGQNLSLGMRQLNGIDTQWYNRRHRTVGHLFQGRYKAILIQKESHLLEVCLLEVCRYVVLNPVRGKTVEKAEQWKWSSWGRLASLKLRRGWP